MNAWRWFVIWAAFAIACTVLLTLFIEEIPDAATGPYGGTLSYGDSE